MTQKIIGTSGFCGLILNLGTQVHDLQPAGFGQRSEHFLH